MIPAICHGGKKMTDENRQREQCREVRNKFSNVCTTNSWQSASQESERGRGKIDKILRI